jgi:hypothetical protein
MKHILLCHFKCATAVIRVPLCVLCVKATHAVQCFTRTKENEVVSGSSDLMLTSKFEMRSASGNKIQRCSLTAIRNRERSFETREFWNITKTLSNYDAKDSQ